MFIYVKKQIYDSQVFVETNVGSFIGNWIDELVPVPGSYNVELEFESLEFYEKSINAEMKIQYCGKIFLISGLIEDEDPDGIKYLRLGSDLILTDFRGDELKGFFVTLKASKINIYPI